jgi:hypothetical protein
MEASHLNQSPPLRRSQPIRGPHAAADNAEALIPAFAALQEQATPSGKGLFAAASPSTAKASDYIAPNGPIHVDCNFFGYQLRLRCTVYVFCVFESCRAGVAPCISSFVAAVRVQFVVSLMMSFKQAYV